MVSRSQFWTSVILAAMSAAVLVASTRMTYSTDFGPGPGFFPFWASAVMLVCSSYQAIMQLRRPAAGAHSEGRTWPDARGLRRVILIMAGVVAVAALSSTLGFRLSLLLLLAYLILAVERQSLRRSIAVLIVVPVGFWLLFDVLLNIQFPIGILGV